MSTVRELVARDGVRGDPCPPGVMLVQRDEDGLPIRIVLRCPSGSGAYLTHKVREWVGEPPRPGDPFVELSLLSAQHGVELHVDADGRPSLRSKIGPARRSRKRWGVMCGVVKGWW